jgi:putative Holliday junction resolvase
MRTMGLDLGSVTCGIAYSDPMKIIASAKETYRFQEDDYQDCRDYVVSLLKKQSVDEIVLGLPKHMNGDIGIKAQICLDFKEMLEEKTDVKVVMWDERLTTVAASRILISADLSRKKRKKVIDQMAAVQILQSYLDKK